MIEPSNAVVDGERDRSGRFAPGNKVGRGNPMAARVAKLRCAMLEAVSDDDMTAIIRKLVELAREGDVQAAKEVLMRTLGKPQEIDLVERLEALEGLLAAVRSHAS